MAGKRSTREEQAEVSRIVAKKLKISLEDANELLGRDDDVLETYEKIGGVVPRTNKKGGSVSRKTGGGIGVTKKDVQASARRRKRTPAMGVTPKDVKRIRMPRKKSPAMGVTPKDVKRAKVRRSAQKMADVEKGVTGEVKRGKKYSDIAKTISETGGLRGKIARGALSLQGVIGDTTYKEAIKRGKAQGAKARKEARTATDRTGKEHMDPYGTIRKSITGKNRKGGTVKRKRGGKIMVGYKAGGKV